MPTVETWEKSKEEAGDKLQEGADQAKKQFQKTGEHLRAQAENAFEDFINLVRRHPGKALGITLGVGFAVGTLASTASRRRTSPADQLKGLAGSGSDAWERLRSGFQEAACTLKDAVDDAVKQFK